MVLLRSETHPRRSWLPRRNLAERLVEQPDAFVYISLRNVHWWSEPDHVGVEAALADQQTVCPRALHQFRGFRERRFFRLPVANELESLHHPHAAHVADQRILFLQLFEF